MQSQVYCTSGAGCTDEEKTMKASAAISDAITSRDTEIASIRTDMAVLKLPSGQVGYQRGVSSCQRVISFGK
jgi:hypothetical protein